MNREMNILLEGRELVEYKVLEQTSEKVVTVSEYNDGTILKFNQAADNISVECNKELVLQEDGKTVKIVG